MSRRPQLSVRARLTLLYTGLFAVGGAIVVAVSYALVAQLGVPGHGQRLPTAALIRFVAGCRSARLSTNPGTALAAKCSTALLQLGAQNQRDRTLSHLLQYSLITLVVVIALAAVLGWVFSGRTLRPVHRITAAARAASEHNLSARVSATGPRDELRELAETFDGMLARLQAAFQSQQRFIANASHELRTPLAVMRATVDVVSGNPESTPGDLHAMADEVRAAVDHAEHLIGALLILARNDRGLTVHEQTDLATVAEDVLDVADLRDRQVHTTLEPAIFFGDPLLAERLVANLIDNAVLYNIAAGQIWVSTATTAAGAQLSVTNTGPVVSPADANRILQPFERLNDRAAHDGYGLGLAIATSIVAVHEGILTALPREEGGLCVTVVIPSTGPAPAGQMSVDR